MMKIKFITKSIFFSCLFFVAASFFANKASAAPRLYLDPSAVTSNQNKDFQVSVMIDSESSPVFGADAVVTFSSSDITVKSITNGNFFSDFSSAQSSGKIEIHGFFSTLYQTKSGNGTLATITFNSNKNSGSGTINFVCSGSGSDTEILNSNGQNILSCGSLNLATITYSGSATASPSPTPTSGGSSTNSCGGTCGSNYNCDSGLYCYQGYCRNAACSSDSDCVCPTAAPTQKPTTKPVVGSTTRPTPGGVITLVKATPYPSPVATDSANLPLGSTQKQNKINFGLIALYVGLGLLGIGAVWVIVRTINKKKNALPPTSPPTTDTGNIETYKVEPPLAPTPEDPPFPQNPPSTL